ncbi:autotransporter outer membrane beta-barrel domain-containing protein [Sphingomonas azotifigens]|uniref:autotransporter outer membrane beta-barrel domain-containing protein n=1 Tax=Sphingomonas azotifigens TaxID=330920 RepID=UPI000A05AEA0|nr:autotransporter outer membrane beta-barrel domain-containing protein [Sphingomonas azotifigens]
MVATGQAGIALFDQIPNENGSRSIWAAGGVFDTRMRTDDSRAKGASAVAAAGTDRPIGRQDQLAVGIALAGMLVQPDLDVPRYGQSAKIRVKGAGPLAYFQYTPRAGWAEGLVVRGTATVLLLDNDSTATVFGIKAPKGRSGGEHFAGELRAAYSWQLGHGRRSFLKPVAGIRLTHTAFRDPLLGHQTDSSVFGKAFLEHEIYTDVTLYGAGGAEVPLSRLKIGIDPVGPVDLRNNVPALFAYQAGLRVRGGRRWSFGAELSGKDGRGLHQLGGLVRLRYDFDKRLGG